MQPTVSASSSHDYNYDYGHGHGHGKSEEGVTYAVRQRSVSNGAADRALPRAAFRGGVEGEGEGAGAGASGLERSNTTGGKNLAQSLKRRLGSLRRRGGGEGVGY
jgi:hypothetical protein